MNLNPDPEFWPSLDPDPRVTVSYVINFEKNIKIVCHRAVDPDPHRSPFICPPGSGSRGRNFEGKKTTNAK